MKKFGDYNMRDSFDTEDLVSSALYKGISDALLMSLEHDEEFYEEFMNIFIHKLKNNEKWLDELKEALDFKPTV